jgi:uncharacterized Rmd1/YagE family protein
MRCTAYCTAASYNLTSLLGYLKKTYAVTLYRDVIHVAYHHENGTLFFFSYGVMVAWGLSEDEELRILEDVKGFEKETLPQLEKDEYDFSYDLNFRVQRDEIVLNSKDILTKLAVSYALAQSVKLTVFERTIDKTIAKTKHLPKDLARKGKIFLSRKEISQKIGELFIDRSSVNLHSDILDEPDFFWEYPEHHSLYRDTAKCFDLTTRLEVLNTRLVIVGELLGMLSDQLNHQHSSTLELTIIWLIVIEVVLAVLRDIFHLI